MKKINNYINGKSITFSEKFLDVFDPSKGEKISEVVMSNSKDFSETINSSKKAFYKWSQVTPLKRSRIISKYKGCRYKRCHTWSISNE